MLCPNCGKELPDAAQFCDACGAKIPMQDRVEQANVGESYADSVLEAAANFETQPDSSTATLFPAEGTQKKQKRQIVLISVALLVVLLSVLTIKILSRPDLTMDDFQENMSYPAMLWKFGIPTYSGTSDESDFPEKYYIYRDCIQFYGTTLDSLSIYPESKEYVIFSHSSDVKERLERILDRYCDLENYSSFWGFYEYSYHGYDILATDDYHYVRIRVD